MTAVIKDLNVFEIVAVPLNGARPHRDVKRGRPLSIGEHLAYHPGPLTGDLHSPINGRVVNISERAVVIRRDSEVAGKTPAPVNFYNLPAIELAQAFKRLGLDIPEVYPGEAFVVQTFDPEPGISCSPALFSEHRESMLAGLEALNALYPEHPVIWASNGHGQIPEEYSNVIVDSAYPFSMPHLVKRSVNGRFALTDGGVFRGRDLYFLGRVWRTGLPLTRMPLTLGQANYLVPIGARIVDLLTFANLKPGPKDVVIKGGLVRGKSIWRLNRGLGKKDEALHLVKGARGRAAVLPCRACGECNKACPAGLSVAKAGRAPVEQWLDGRFQKEFVGCFQCGACALACPSHRPLLSLARLSS